MSLPKSGLLATSKTGVILESLVILENGRYPRKRALSRGEVSKKDDDNNLHNSTNSNNNTQNESNSNDGNTLTVTRILPPHSIVGNEKVENTNENTNENSCSPSAYRLCKYRTTGKAFVEDDLGGARKIEEFEILEVGDELKKMVKGDELKGSDDGSHPLNLEDLFRKFGVCKVKLIEVDLFENVFLEDGFKGYFDMIYDRASLIAINIEDRVDMIMCTSLSCR